MSTTKPVKSNSGVSMNSRYQHLLPVRASDFPRYVEQIHRSNNSLEFSCYETAPVWLVINELQRVRGAAGVGHLFRSPDDVFLVLSWDSDCHEDERNKPYWYDYSVLFPLTTDAEILGASVTAYASELVPFMNMPGSAKIQHSSDWRRLYQDTEFVYPTQGLIALQSPETQGLSRPMRKRRSACAKFLDTSHYEVLDLDDVPDYVLSTVFSEWLRVKSGEEDDVEVAEEYSLLTQKLLRQKIKDIGVELHGIALIEKATQRCLGFTVSTRVSTYMWASIARIHLRSGNGTPPYVGEFLWREEAKHWNNVPWETDGGGSEGEDTESNLGLTLQKAITFNALVPYGAHLRNQTSLTGPNLAQSRRFLSNRRARQDLIEGLKNAGFDFAFPDP
jgi:hypothetical protein